MPESDRLLGEISNNLQYVLASLPNMERIEELLEKIIEELENIKNKLPA